MQWNIMIFVILGRTNKEMTEVSNHTDLHVQLQFVIPVYGTKCGQPNTKYLLLSLKILFYISIVPFLR